MGGPVIVPCAFDYKYYDGTDLLDLIEDGFYDDYEPYDNLQIQLSFPVLGGQECLDSLVDLGAGDFDVSVPTQNSIVKNGIIDIDGMYQVGMFGDGMSKAGTGCNGCTGCNVQLDKSKIRDHMQTAGDPNDPNYRRRYDNWNGVGCGGCGYLIYMGPPLYYNDWGYGDYN